MPVRIRYLTTFHTFLIGFLIAVAVSVGSTIPVAAHGAIHVVTQGETLSEIAQRYGTSTEYLRQLNGLQNVNVIYYGLPLVVPDSTEEELSGDALLSNENDTESEPGTIRSGKWIEVDLSEQSVTAYEDMLPVRSFIVSTGLPGTPTVTGEFRIWAKTAIQDMYGGNRAAGDYYYLEDVEWVQYFFEDYAFHGTYWHENFGQPMSRGCVNMRNEDAKWLFEWADPIQPVTDGRWLFSDADNPGTLVVVYE